MKYIAILFLLFTACSSSQSISNKGTGSNILTKSDSSDEYELLIIDPGFDRWFSVNRRPVDFHALSYYEQQNIRYVRAWNNMVDLQGRYATAVDYPFENKIQYNRGTDYGLELNYQLYYYFKYIEDKYGRRYNFPN